MEDVYLRVEVVLRARLGRRRNLDACLRLGMWLARQHGPYGGRAFPLPRYELAQDPRFAEQVGLTYTQIRSATAALENVGFLARLGGTVRRRMPGRFGAFKSTPSQFQIGPDFAPFFPAAKLATKKVQDSAPLFVATRSKPMPRPLRLAPQPQGRSLEMARLEALVARPLPMLSAMAHRTLAMRRW